jgi:hypothetical protein
VFLLIIHVIRCQDKNMTCHRNPRPSDDTASDFVSVISDNSIQFVHVIQKGFVTHRI